MVLLAELLIESRVEEIARAREWLSERARVEGFEDKDVNNIGLAMSEACANVIKHAYGEQPGNPIKLRLAIDTSRLILSICDQGEKYDPDSYTPPDLSKPQDGGYGVFLIRNLMDEVHYDSSSERGTSLTLVRHRSSTQG